MQTKCKNRKKYCKECEWICGRKYDEKGDLYHLFYEVGTNHKDKGTSNENKLYVKTNQSLEGTSFLKHTNKANKHYFVTQIRKIYLINKDKNKKRYILESQIQKIQAL